MGIAGSPEPAKLIAALMASDETALAQGRTRLSQEFGDIDVESGIYPFSFSTYYQDDMGADLIKQFVSFKDLVDPGTLASVKQITNNMERATKRSESLPGRGINLDPGYINGAQLVLATTKNYSHRLYLDQGIYGELTLMFSKGVFHPLPWTYRDYKTDLAATFFIAVRQLFLSQR